MLAEWLILIFIFFSVFILTILGFSNWMAPGILLVSYCCWAVFNSKLCKVTIWILGVFEVLLYM